MRSGNTLFRKLIEQISGTITGSNLKNSFTHQLQLACEGFKGENITDDRVWAIKTHFPYVYNFMNKPVSGNRAIVIVRNPLDSLVSLF
mmetsp:Transcript_13517/g.9742  ORF Transcript_13517/g.9742 Transcript_13517/m.9742 type:complete len:88 (+) Transcript_13517:577-840(+)